jgi:putative drug exporter of the RND superfamily
MFDRWARFVYRFRWATLAGGAVVLGLSIAGIFSGGNVNANQPSTTTESDRAANLVQAELPQVVGTGSSFILLFSSPDLAVADPSFRAALESAVAPLQSDPSVTSVVTPYGQSSDGLVSRDGHQAVVVVHVKDRSNVAAGYVQALRSKVHAGLLHVVLTGNVPINSSFNKTLEADLQRA